MAEVIGVSLRTIQLYEVKDANIPIKNLTKIANYFEVSIAELYMYEVNENGEAYINEKVLSKKGNKIYTIGQKKKLIMAPLLFQEEQKEYLTNHLNQSFLEELPQIGFVMDYLDDGAYMAFEILGDGMNDGTIDAVPNKAIVLGKEMENEAFESVEAGTNETSAVIVCGNRILCKNIISYNKEKDSIICHNLNELPEYKDFELPMKDVLKVFKIVKKQID
ncbi:MAG: hypothetical protein COA50_04230 [Flavobacteriaceae bacterium]|nr:MAG: hypothetical protein COA50_04230 [Flavobacteriaceae bacterium]